MRMVNVKEMKMISAMRIIMSVMVTAMVTDKSIRFSWPGDRNHPRDWDPHHPLHLPLCEDQEGMRRWKVLEVRCHYQRVTWDICNFALVRQINVAKEKSDPEKQSNSPAWGFSNEKIPSWIHYIPVWTSFFNRSLGNGWLDLDDFFGRPSWNFISDEMVKSPLARLHAPAQKFRILRKADFCPNVLRCFCALILWGKTWNFQG